MVDIMATDVGDSFDEVLLQGIESEVGETLEVVARAVTLEVELPDEVRIESLGAFPARSLHGRDQGRLGGRGWGQLGPSRCPWWVRQRGHPDDAHH